MRKFWITFKMQLPQAVIEGDSVLDMPDGYKLNVAYLDMVKESIVAGLHEQLKLAGSNEPLDYHKLLILACIELEE